MPSALPFAVITPSRLLDKRVIAFSVLNDCSYARAAITLISEAMGDGYETPATRARLRASLAADADEPRVFRRRIRMPESMKTVIADEALLFRAKSRAAMMNALLGEGLYQVAKRNVQRLGDLAVN